MFFLLACFNVFLRTLASFMLNLSPVLEHFQRTICCLAKLLNSDLRIILAIKWATELKG